MREDSREAMHVWEAVTHLRQFLEYLERTSSPEAPLLPPGKLIWPGDKGKKKQQRDREIKYIPEQILLQLEQHMHLLPTLYLPVVIILRASGWRIADVLNLQQPDQKAPVIYPEDEWAFLVWGLGTGGWALDMVAN